MGLLLSSVEDYLDPQREALSNVEILPEAAEKVSLAIARTPFSTALDFIRACGSVVTIVQGIPPYMAPR